MEISSEALKKEDYKAGDFIFFEGDLETHFYIIEKGQVQIFTKNQFGKRIDILTVEEGESFGEFALLDNKPRSASAQALTDVSLIRVSEEGYESLLSDLPIWTTSMMRSFIRRLKSMNEILKETDQFLPRK
ncbi:MAG TPA: cyclic nucleotide-binding domain-containing protein [Pseudobdellovibrionaceae bacterium]|nr:cyclic nucleotide-binding domain-containing protein [Pseudobdellovibrionaceae bacterium]